MLSYNAPVPVNGQSPVSPTNMSTSRQIMASTKPARQSRPTEVTSNNSTAVNGHAHHKHHHIWLVTGPAGCGKSTVAKHVADSLSMPYIEGDEVCFLNPPYNNPQPLSCVNVYLTEYCSSTHLKTSRR